MVDANLDPYTDGNSLFLPWYQWGCWIIIFFIWQFIYQ
jgi:hypothetical protein